MQYVCLIYQKPNTDPQVDGAPQALLDEYMKLTSDIKESGEFLAGDALVEAKQATTVSVREGEVITADGPFAETHEVLVGYYLVEVDSFDRAVQIAARIPAARWGRIEVRAIWDYNTTGE